MKRIVLAAVFLVTASGQALACSVPFVPFIEGQTVEARMTVKSGASCGGSYNSLGPIESQTITQRPTHGRVDIAGASTRYRSAKGYVGPDTFTVTMRGRDHLNRPSVKSVRVLVTVTP